MHPFFMYEISSYIYSEFFFIHGALQIIIINRGFNIHNIIKYYKGLTIIYSTNYVPDLFSFSLTELSNDLASSVYWKGLRTLKSLSITQNKFTS